MKTLFEFLIINQIEEDLKILNEDKIDEGKIKDGLKKAWGWIKSKFKKKKKENKSGSSDYSPNISDDIENNSEDNEFSYKIYKYDQIKEKIYKNNNLNKGKDIIDKGYDNKISIAIAEDDKENAVGCLFFITHDKYERPTEFSQYKDFDHIFSMQIDKIYFNTGISEGLLKVVLKKIKSLSSYKGLTLDIREYNTKPKLYEKYFEIEKNKDNKIAVYKE